MSGDDAETVVISSYLPFAQAISWKGRASVQNLIIFGDSYSVPAFDGGLTRVLPLAEMLDILLEHVYNFAFGGATAEDDLKRQLSSFSACVRADSASEPPPSASSLYVLAFGINDCGTHWEDDLAPVVKKVLDAARNLRAKADARHFLFIDVPPINQSPGCLDNNLSDLLAPRYRAWNELLGVEASAFASALDVNVFIFSQHALLSDIILDPRAFGLVDELSIWLDHLHLASSSHRVLADAISAALLM